jgi:hypothetical protein
MVLVQQVSDVLATPAGPIAISFFGSGYKSL